MNLAEHFSAYWGLIAIAVAGVTAIVGILWDAKDKETKKITIWGKILFCITIVSTVGALVSQFFERRASDARNKKSQDETVQLLDSTRQSILELSRILQPLDQPEVTLDLDLACGPVAYEAFCSSVQTQANEAYARHQELPSQLRSGTLGRVTTRLFVDSSLKIDWSKWPTAVDGPISFVSLGIFRTKEKFEARPECVSCGDLSLSAIVTPKMLTPIVSVETNGVRVKFSANLKKINVSIRGTDVMSVPDLHGAVVALGETGFEILTPTKITIKTPRGQNITSSDFRPREGRFGRLFFAEFPEN